MEQSLSERFLDAITRDEDEETRDLARKVYNSVHSGGFRWIGVGEVEDEKINII